jgi:hypothetical protein
MHHRLHASPDRLKPSQAHQVQGGGAQRGHHAGAIAPVAVGVLMELGVADPVPTLNAPAVSHQLQQGCCCGAQACEKQVACLKWLAVSGIPGSYLHDPAGADPGFSDVIRCLFGAQRPGDVTAVADLVIRCHKRDLALALELAADLAVQCVLISLDRQEEVGPLLLELSKNGRWV